MRTNDTLTRSDTTWRTIAVVILLLINEAIFGYVIYQASRKEATSDANFGVSVASLIITMTTVYYVAEAFSWSNDLELENRLMKVKLEHLRSAVDKTSNGELSESEMALVKNFADLSSAPRGTEEKMAELRKEWKCLECKLDEALESVASANVTLDDIMAAKPGHRSPDHDPDADDDQGAVERLGALVGLASAENETLKGELATLRDQCSAHESTIRSLRADHQQKVRADVERETQERLRLLPPDDGGEQRAEPSVECLVDKGRIRLMEEEARALRDTLRLKELESDTLRIDIDMRIGENERIAAELNDLRFECEHYKVMTNSLHHIERGRTDGLQLEVVALGKVLESLEKQVVDLENERQRLEDALDEANESETKTFRAAQEMLAAHSGDDRGRRLVESLTEQLRQQKVVSDALRSRLSSSLAENESLTTVATSLSSDCEKYRGKVELLERQLEHLAAANREHVRNSAFSCAELAKLHQEKANWLSVLNVGGGMTQRLRDAQTAERTDDEGSAARAGRVKWKARPSRKSAVSNIVINQVNEDQPDDTNAIEDAFLEMMEPPFTKTVVRPSID